MPSPRPSFAMALITTSYSDLPDSISIPLWPFFGQLIAKFRQSPPLPYYPLLRPSIPTSSDHSPATIGNFLLRVLPTPLAPVSVFSVSILLELPVGLFAPTSACLSLFFVSILLELPVCLSAPTSACSSFNHIRLFVLKSTEFNLAQPAVNPD